METYQAVTSWALFLGLGVFCALYYWPQGQQRVQQVVAKTPTRPQAARPQIDKRPHSYAEAVKSGDSKPKQPQQESADVPRKRGGENKKPQPVRYEVAPAPAVQDDEPEVDSSTKQFAEQMLKARKGEVISGNKSQEQRVKTVKQSSALNTVSNTEQTTAATTSASAQSGDVSDMLEPTSSGPSVLRVTGSVEPAKDKAKRAPKEEQIESKKQRQNRKKVEEKRLLREAEEQERKALLEKQRRTARESRGEPARNGIPASKPTTNNIWTNPTSAPINEAPAANGANTAPLLDTFDAESTSSSNGAPGLSTAATSTDGAGLPSEEEQMAQAMKESGDDSGWTTVAVPKKQQKKKPASSGEETPVPERAAAPPKPKPAAPKTGINGKPKGFQALKVEYEQRTTNVDPDDPESWDA